MRSQVEKFHFVVHYAHRNQNGRLMDVETNLSVFDTKTLAIVQTVAESRMFGFVGKGNFSLVPVKTGSGEAPRDHIRLPIFVKGRKKWLRATYLGVMLGLARALDDDSGTNSEHELLVQEGVPVDWLLTPVFHAADKRGGSGVTEE